MPRNLVDRRAVLKTMSAAAVAGAVAARPQRVAAQQVKWSAGTEPPKLRAPPLRLLVLGWLLGAVTLGVGILVGWAIWGQ